jgi:hypothetical protein
VGARHGQHVHGAGAGVGVPQFVVEHVADAQHQPGGNGVLLPVGHVLPEHPVGPGPHAEGSGKHRVGRPVPEHLVPAGLHETLVVHLPDGEVGPVVELAGVGRRRHPAGRPPDQQPVAVGEGRAGFVEVHEHLARGGPPRVPHPDLRYRQFGLVTVGPLLHFGGDRAGKVRDAVRLVHQVPGVTRGVVAVGKGGAGQGHDPEGQHAQGGPETSAPRQPLAQAPPDSVQSDQAGQTRVGKTYVEGQSRQHPGDAGGQVQQQPHEHVRRPGRGRRRLTVPVEFLMLMV